MFINGVTNLYHLAIFTPKCNGLVSFIILKKGTHLTITGLKSVKLFHNII